MAKAAINIEDLRQLARQRLPRILFDWIDGGAGDEQGLRDNIAALARYRFMPRYLVDIKQREQTRRLFGKDYSSPFGISPTGFAGLFRPGADLLLAAAARRANLPYIMSGTSVSSIERAMTVAPDHTWYQLYPAADWSVTRDVIARCHRTGCQTLVITIDIPVEAKRERDIRNGFGLPLKLTPSLLLDGLAHPRWLWGYLQNGGMPVMENWAPYAGEGASALQVAAYVNQQHGQAAQTWDDLRKYRDLWPGNLVIKGIMHPEDAVRAIVYGADGLIVSNHGGRQYDRAVAAPVMLQELRQRVGDTIPLMMDGGIRRGSDILAALCLGADFTFVGRATLFGTVALGAKGADLAISILQNELDLLMGQIGCTSLDRDGLTEFLVPA